MDMQMQQRRRAELSEDAAWRAAFIIFDRLGKDARIWRHVDLDTATLDFKAMLDEGTFSGGERRLIEIAASLFNQEHDVNLWSVLRSLDDASAVAVERAIHSFLWRDEHVEAMS